MDDTANNDTTGILSSGAFSALISSINEGLIGHADLTEKLMIGLLTGGHILLEGPPGVAKTRAVKLLAERLAASHSRIQCTPDLLPSDLTGTQVFKPQNGEFEFVEGPLFHSLVLVDEINRAPPKVQSALLESMAEGQITSGGVTRALPQPFMIVATQNPIEQEGTFPLPEAQLDRFTLQMKLSLPDAENELAILELVENENQGQMAHTDFSLPVEEIMAARTEVAKVHLAPALKDYIIRLVMATREDGAVSKWVEHPVSPRGTLALAAAARARAWLNGRNFANPEDVQGLAADALSHRLVPNWAAMSEGKTRRDIIHDALEEVQPW